MERRENESDEFNCEYISKKNLMKPTKGKKD